MQRPHVTTTTSATWGRQRPCFAHNTGAITCRSRQGVCKPHDVEHAAALHVYTPPTPQQAPHVRVCESHDVEHAAALHIGHHHPQVLLVHKGAVQGQQVGVVELPHRLQQAEGAGRGDGVAGWGQWHALPRQRPSSLSADASRPP